MERKKYDSRIISDLTFDFFSSELPSAYISDQRSQKVNCQHKQRIALQNGAERIFETIIIIKMSSEGKNSAKST